MTVCLFGNYIADYPRVVVMKKGLQQNGIRVLECHTRRTGFGKYWDLYRKHSKIAHSYDVLLVGMGCYTVVWFARLLSKRPIVFDAFVSLYLTNVEDRKICPPGSLLAKYYSFWDRFSCVLSLKVLLDTSAQIEYFAARYKLDKSKFVRIYVGADSQIFYRNRKIQPARGEFVVHWHGHIVPFHGLQIILQAADKLRTQKDIVFRIVTRFNQVFETFKKMSEDFRLDNVEFYGETDYRGLAKQINEADICLGVFGDNRKAQLVIPNKIFEAIACEKPVISGDHPAIRELFLDGVNIVTVSADDPLLLADKILWLRNEPGIRKRIAKQAFSLYENSLTPKVLGQELLKVFSFL